MKRTIGLGGALALGLTVLMGSAPALAAETATIHVPSDFNPVLEDTRLQGSYEVVDSGLHIQTHGTTREAKVAEYVDTNVPLARVGEPTLEYTATSGAVPPGFQLQVDFDNDSSIDGILVGEPKFYGTDWWASGGSKPFVKSGAPHDVSSGSGGDYHGTLTEWRAKFPNAQVKAFGFSLGSGVEGDGVLNAINLGDVRYTFAEDVVLTSKDECKDGGWAASYPTTYRNQGDCVSFFAKLSPKQLAKLK